MLASQEQLFFTIQLVVNRFKKIYLVAFLCALVAVIDYDQILCCHQRFAKLRLLMGH
jgi:hypothetical protein